jgi:hypothetical protein
MGVVFGKNPLPNQKLPYYIPFWGAEVTPFGIFFCFFRKKKIITKLFPVFWGSTAQPRLFKERVAAEKKSI